MIPPMANNGRDTERTDGGGKGEDRVSLIGSVIRVKSGREVTASAKTIGR